CSASLHFPIQSRRQAGWSNPWTTHTKGVVFHPAVADAGGIASFMFDVLVYLYENYWRPDACPDHDQLTRKLSAVGFESDEIQEALSWLDGLATAAESYSGEQSSQSLRVFTPAEQEVLGEDSIGF